MVAECGEIAMNDIEHAVNELNEYIDPNRDIPMQRPDGSIRTLIQFVEGNKSGLWSAKGMKRRVDDIRRFDRWNG